VSFIAPVFLVQRCDRWAGANTAARRTTRHPFDGTCTIGTAPSVSGAAANTGDHGQAPSRPRWAVHRRSSQPARTRIHLSNSYHDEFHVARRPDQGPSRSSSGTSAPASGRRAPYCGDSIERLALPVGPTPFRGSSQPS